MIGKKCQYAASRRPSLSHGGASRVGRPKRSVLSFVRPSATGITKPAAAAAGGAAHQQPQPAARRRQARSSAALAAAAAAFKIFQ